MDFQNLTSSPFYFRNGSLYCENLEINKLIEATRQEEEAIALAGKNAEICGRRIFIDAPLTPVYIYSSAAIKRNVSKYLDALNFLNLNGTIGYAVKANNNIHLLYDLKKYGVSMIIAVSGYEILAAIQAGFAPENILLNGNGKQEWEIKLAIQLGTMMNIDSKFDAQRIVNIYGKFGYDKKIKVLLRMKPTQTCSGDLSTHEFLNTAEDSKFGFELSELDEILEILSKIENIQVLGVHCHFGSSIGDPKIYSFIGETICLLADELRKRDIHIEYADVGGGIGIDYHEIPSGFNDALILQDPEVSQEYYKISNLKKRDSVAKIPEFIQALSNTIPKNLKLILEPGRSLVGNAGILVCKVLGEKKARNRKIMVVDGSMNEVIRPCLYGAHHNIFPTRIDQEEKWEPFDIVGPICESADFLGKQVPIQKSIKYLAVMDCGAYCSSMASTYNLKPRPAEILVDNESCTRIRKRGTFEDIVKLF